MALKLKLLNVRASNIKLSLYFRGDENSKWIVNLSRFIGIQAALFYCQMGHENEFGLSF